MIRLNLSTAVPAVLLVLGLGACGGPSPSPSGSPAALGSPTMAAPPASRSLSTSRATPTPSPSASPASSASASSSAAAVPSPSPSPSPAAVASPSPSVPAPSAAVAGGPPTYQAIGDIGAGTCYDPVTDVDDGTLLAALLRPCGERHSAEVFGVGRIPGREGDPYPGAEQTAEQARQICEPAFEAYVGLPYVASSLVMTIYSPTAGTWAGGDRLVVCTLAAEGERLKGSARGTRR